MLTGLDKNKARFQALSAFSGTGFTTKESESIVNHLQRRKIVRYLMIMGNAGIVTVIVAATSSMVTSRGYELPMNILILIVGILLIYRLAKFRGFIQKWERFIEKKLIKSPAFIAGIYGMNFEFMPELKWRWAYFGIWGAILVITFSMPFYFKRKKWFNHD